jgi:hypothetical protein
MTRNFVPTAHLCDCALQLGTVTDAYLFQPTAVRHCFDTGFAEKFDFAQWYRTQGTCDDKLLGRCSLPLYPVIAILECH